MQARRRSDRSAPLCTPRPSPRRGTLLLLTALLALGLGVGSLVGAHSVSASAHHRHPAAVTLAVVTGDQTAGSHRLDTDAVAPAAGDRTVLVVSTGVARSIADTQQRTAGTSPARAPPGQSQA